MVTRSESSHLMPIPCILKEEMFDFFSNLRNSISKIEHFIAID